MQGRTTAIQRPKATRWNDAALRRMIVKMASPGRSSVGHSAPRAGGRPSFLKVMPCSTPPLDPESDAMFDSAATMPRRDVLKRAASLSTAGLLFPMIVPRHVVSGGKTAPPSETLNVAAIGAGYMGSINIRNAHRAGARIAALCEVDQEAATPIEEQFPDAARYRDFRRLLDREKSIDAVIVSTPDHTHAAIAIAAMRLGKHVYCEKPLAHTIYEVRKMTEVANRNRVVTQMGNQGHSFHSMSEFTECILSGALGDVREVHAVQAAFNYSRIDQLASIDENHPVPESLDWGLWLGPAPYRKYNPMYHPGRWRGWQQFGSGNLGDFVCHIVDPAYRALDLGAPESIVAEAEGFDTKLHRETFPKSSKIRFEFPERGGRPPVTLFWYDGDRYRPPHPEELKPGEESIPVPGWVPSKQVGAMVVGEKGKIVYGSHGAKDWRIIPDRKMKQYMGDRKRQAEPEVSGPPSNLKHLKRWLEACKGGTPAESNFDYGGSLTEVALLGNVALRMPGTTLNWDARHMTFPNQPRANQYLHTPYRDGWHL